MNQQLSAKPSAVWQEVVAKDVEYFRALKQLHDLGPARLDLLRSALRGPERNVALRVARFLPEDELKELLPEWVHLARCAHGPFFGAWNIIESLPRHWVLARIEPLVDHILENEEEDDYWMFLQLFERLDRDLTLKLARRAVNHTDPEIRDLGQDHLGRLGHCDGSPNSSPTVPPLPVGNDDAATTAAANAALEKA